MQTPQTVANSSNVDLEMGTPERPSGDDKVATLSALPGAPCAPVGDDKLPKPVSAFHSTEGDSAEPPASEATTPDDSEQKNSTSGAGRPKEFTDFHKAQVCGLIGAGMSQRQAAQYLGFSPSIVSQTLRRDAKFAGDVARAVASARFQPLYNMMQASKRSWRAAAWLLRYGQPHTDLAERDARRAIRKAEKLAAEEAIRERERRRQRQVESDEEFLATVERVTRDRNETT